MHLTLENKSKETFQIVSMSKWYTSTVKSQ